MVGSFLHTQPVELELEPAENQAATGLIQTQVASAQDAARPIHVKISARQQRVINAVIEAIKTLPAGLTVEKVLKGFMDFGANPSLDKARELLQLFGLEEMFTEMAQGLVEATLVKYGISQDASDKAASKIDLTLIEKISSKATLMLQGKADMEMLKGLIADLGFTPQEFACQFGKPMLLNGWKKYAGGETC